MAAKPTQEMNATYEIHGEFPLNDLSSYIDTIKSVLGELRGGGSAKATVCLPAEAVIEIEE